MFFVGFLSFFLPFFSLCCHGCGWVGFSTTTVQPTTVQPDRLVAKSRMPDSKLQAVYLFNLNNSVFTPFTHPTKVAKHMHTRMSATQKEKCQPQ